MKMNISAEEEIKI